MTTQGGTQQEIESFLSGWSAGSEGIKSCFLQLYSSLGDLEGIELAFVTRPGVSYSLRPRHPSQQGRDLFAMIDIIDDDPADRWISVCFYGDMISDPESYGELIPGGLAGSDGYCFDMYTADEKLTDYLKIRLQEAYRQALG